MGSFRTVPRTSPCCPCFSGSYPVPELSLPFWSSEGVLGCRLLRTLSAGAGRSTGPTRWRLFIVYPCDVDVVTEKLSGVGLCARNVVGLPFAVSALVHILVVVPAPGAVVAQGLLEALVAPGVQRQPFVPIMGTPAARTDDAWGRSGLNCGFVILLVQAWNFRFGGISRRILEDSNNNSTDGR